MAAYCFVCDAPVDGERCSRCGRPATHVDEPPREDRPSLAAVLRAVPSWVWPTLALGAALVLFTLLRAAFRLG